MKELLFAAVDVDDNAFHIAVVDEKSNLISTLKSSPNASSLTKVLQKNTPKDARLRLCYESTYLGYSLQRSLAKKKISCDVIAPTSIPKSPNQKVKTDRTDAVHLAKCFQKGLLAVVDVPTETEEADRDLIRERQFLVKSASSLKRLILNKCRRLNWNYKQTEKKKDYWTPHHRKWLDEKVKKAPTSAALSLRILLMQLKSTQDGVAQFDAEISSLAKTPVYKDKVNTLRAFKGIEVHTALALVTEIRDIRRFKHPKNLVSYCGLDISEYSSGGKEHRYKITKMGNKHIRKLLVESSQFSWTRPTASKKLKARRIDAPRGAEEIADRCLKRLYGKGHRLLIHRKPRNKVKVACAREMIGFIWEALNKVA